MRVSISNHNKPAPVAPVVLGALIGGAASIGAASISAGAGAARNAQQQRFRKEEIALLDQIADENATIAYNRQREMTTDAYQKELEQWERENAYNDPSAVAARYRAAGINPRAAFNGVSGAGISGGSPSVSFPSVSPAASSAGGTPSLVVPDTSALNSLSNIPFQVAQAKKLQSEAELDAQKAESEKFDREVVQPSVAALNESLKNLNVSKAEAQKIETTFIIQLRNFDIALREAELANYGVIMEKTRSDIQSNEAYRSLTEEQKKEINARVDLALAQVEKIGYENKLLAAEIELTRNKSWLAEQQAMREAVEADNKQKAIELMNKQIEMLGQQMKLTEAQIKDLKGRFALDVKKHNFSIDQFNITTLKDLFISFFTAGRKR